MALLSATHPLDHHDQTDSGSIAESRDRRPKGGVEQLVFFLRPVIFECVFIGSVNLEPVSSFCFLNQLGLKGATGKMVFQHNDQIIEEFFGNVTLIDC